MDVVTVEYRESKQFGGCREATIGMAAEVGEGEDAGAALADAKAWVRAELVTAFCEQQQHENDYRRSVAMERHLEELRGDVRAYEERIDHLRATWERAKAFLLHHGLDAELYVAGLPFDEPAGGDGAVRGDDMFRPTFRSPGPALSA